MSNPKRGDVVLYSQLGKVYNALVLGENETNDDRKGAKGESALHLAVILEDPKPLPMGQVPAVTILYDVVHFTHEFSDKYAETYGPESFAHRGAGEWMPSLGRSAVEVQEPSTDLAASSEKPKESKRWGKKP